MAVTIPRSVWDHLEQLAGTYTVHQGVLPLMGEEYARRILGPKEPEGSALERITKSFEKRQRDFKAKYGLEG